MEETNNMRGPNEGAAGKGEIALLFQMVHAGLALPEHGRWMKLSA
jgi:hypothetical protein